VSSAVVCVVIDLGRADDELAEANPAMARSLMLKDAANRATTSAPDDEDVRGSGGIVLQPVHS
jgi:hypothetical protein